MGSHLPRLPQPVPRGEGDSLCDTALGSHMPHPLLADSEEIGSALDNHNMHRVVSEMPDTALDIRPSSIEKGAVVAVQTQTMHVVDSLQVVAAAAERKKALLNHHHW